MSKANGLPPQADGLWLTIGLDPIQQKIITLGLALTRGEMQSHRDLARRNENMIYYHSFDLDAKTGATELLDWLHACGVPGAEAHRLAKEIGAHLIKTWEEIVHES